jgi:prolyl-tRNA editing enzyme YbaK/EbsC (Cys-tRNA(Pro) deacylase)
VHVFPDGVRTAQAAADGLGCPLGAIANSLIFDAAGSPVLILTSGAHRVDTAKVAAGLGLPSLARASAEFVRLHTGQAIGGVAPVGHPAQIPTYLDRALAAYDPIWAAAGHSHAVFDTSYDELRELTGATEIDVN